MADDDLLVLLTEADIEPIEGRLFPLLAPSLNGEKNEEEIIAQVGGSLGLLDTIYGLGELHQTGAITDAVAGAVPHPLDPVAEWLEVAPDDARALREATAVAVRSIAAGGAAAMLEELLRAQGLRVVEEGAAGFELVITDDYLRPELQDFVAGRPWMPVRPFGSVVWVGPVFRPGAGACWSCLTSRLRETRAASGVPESLPLPLSRVAFAPAMHVGLGLAAAVAARSILRPDADSRLLTFDAKSLALRAHAVVRRGNCAACSTSVAPPQYAPLMLQSRRKIFTTDGGHRAAMPEATWAKYELHVSPLVGIVHSVERVPAGGSDLIHVYVARHNYLKDRDRAGRGRSFGKGMTAVEARTGALCEALERYSAVFRGDEPVIRAKLSELGEAAVPPNAILQISERQYAAREDWNRLGWLTLAVPERFDEKRAIGWAPAWSLTRGEIRYVPAAYCYFDYPAEPRFCRADSNGSAAGSSVEDAALQGLFELVERDSVGIWWYSRSRRPEAELRTAYGDAMRSAYAAQGRRLWLLDLTSDLGIPVCAALSSREGGQELLIGFGAHFDPAIAASRAIAEMNLKLPFAGRSEVFTGELTDRSFLEPHPSMPATTMAEGCVETRDDLRDDVIACVDLLREHGLEVLLLDQTREDVGLPVVKVIVPGLRHFRPRFAPGRLYDVPLQLGWIETPLREEELNSAHLGL